MLHLIALSAREYANIKHHTKFSVETASCLQQLIVTTRNKHSTTETHLDSASSLTDKLKI